MSIQKAVDHHFLTQSTGLFVVFAMALPARAEEIGFSFPQVSNPPREQVEALRRLEPWLTKLKFLIESDPEMTPATIR